MTDPIVKTAAKGAVGTGSVLAVVEFKGVPWAAIAGTIVFLLTAANLSFDLWKKWRDRNK